MAYFPFFVDIGGQKGLIVGGGKIALHKIQKLLPYGPILTVVAPEISVAMEQITLENDICVIKRSFEKSDLTGIYFVIAASDQANVNAEIGRLCKERGIFVNVVDNKKECSFLFPSLVKAGNLSIGISTEGTSPDVAAELRSRIASMIPADIDAILTYLGNLRPLAKTYIKDDSKRAFFLKDMAKVCMDSNAVFNEQETMHRLESYIDCEEIGVARVLLVGAGCGSSDLITVRGLRAIRQAQVLVYDDLIDQRLLEHASERCEKIYVGKRSGRHNMPQDQINALLIQKASERGLVVRLKGGDPFVFGRGMEEMLALKKAGIYAEYVPGITSCIAIPAFAGIPVTHRRVSRSFHVITGHMAGQDANNDQKIDFMALARLEGTLVFLMGFGQLQQIAEGLICAGKDSSTPTAVIHGNFDVSVEMVRGTLANIAQKIVKSMIAMPVVVVIGAVVDMEEKE
ncbi:MAG: uroporphyrinogen-III C-methyltransferase [Lachnospiraceae bacterium]|jgi:uroporphyrin-III C-methyltransferase/precorrin-2 dehydrogenase/sirohydrochlorin ferrochelatase|nr:uroporphyrinogen-III C-methyltransferase [Lachnospiraceae bacterium]